MALLDLLFGGQEDKYLDLWKRLRSMPPDQLRDIIEARPNTMHGALACVALYLVSGGMLVQLLSLDREENDGLLVHKISRLRKNDVILMGKGPVFAEIRETLKRMAPIFEEHGA